MARLRLADVEAAGGDTHPAVRARAAELAAAFHGAGLPVLLTALRDPDGRVVEAGCFGLGELGSSAAGHPDVITTLSAVAGGHQDPLCREAAVAALGAIGDPAGLPAVLGALADKPAVRRRAVLALAPFGGPEVDAALAAALRDRDWQVRQAAEDLIEPGPHTPAD